jgi:hypothetical protein
MIYSSKNKTNFIRKHSGSTEIFFSQFSVRLVDQQISREYGNSGGGCGGAVCGFLCLLFEPSTKLEIFNVSMACG